MQTPYTSSTPEAAQAPARLRPRRPHAPRSIMISGSDGKSQTITLSGDGISVNGGGVDRRAGSSSSNRKTPLRREPQSG